MLKSYINRIYGKFSRFGRISSHIFNLVYGFYFQCPSFLECRHSVYAVLQEVTKVLYQR